MVQEALETTVMPAFRRFFVHAHDDGGVHAVAAGAEISTRLAPWSSSAWALALVV